MGVRLSRGFGSSDGVLPALPFDSSMDMAPVGRPEHGHVQRHGGHIIKDERKGVLVTSKIKAVAGLAGNQEQNSQEKQERKKGPFTPKTISRTGIQGRFHSLSQITAQPVPPTKR